MMNKRSKKKTKGCKFCEIEEDFSNVFDGGTRNAYGGIGRRW